MMQRLTRPAQFLLAALLAFAGAVLLLGPAAQHPSAGAVTQGLYVLLLLLGFGYLIAAAVRHRRHRTS